MDPIRTAVKYSLIPLRTIVQLGEVFVDYFLKFKRTEAGRFAQWLRDTDTTPGDETTAWEQNEYFDFF